MIYAKVMKRSQHVHRNSASFMRYYGNANITLSLLTDVMPFNEKDMPPIFEYPFNELLVIKMTRKKMRIHKICIAVADLGSIDQETANGSAHVAARRGGAGQVAGRMQTVQGHGPRGCRGRSRD